MADQLVKQQKAYFCYCTPEELKAKREAAEAAGGAWKYDRTCLRLTPSEIATREASHRPRAVRFRVPEGATRFDDLVHGPIEFDRVNIEDFVILRADHQPTYHLSVVSDDVEMKITHVVRGDDHISNTPKQLLLYDAIGAPVPAFAHVPLILGSDKKRLSKRHGATSVMEYARQGYLPEAMANFLALLGWSPGSGDRELFTRKELADVFDLSGISGGSAVFNSEKLDWFNQQYIVTLAPEELTLRIKPLLENAGLWNAAFLAGKHGWFFSVLELLKPRAKRLEDFVSMGQYFFSDDVLYDEAAVAKHVRAERMADHLRAVDSSLHALEAFDPESLEAAVRSVADARGVKAGALIQAIRVAVSGRTATPGMFEVLSLLGRDRVHQRLRSSANL
jgi:glutamyl-tRNA synthetase